MQLKTSVNDLSVRLKGCKDMNVGPRRRLEKQMRARVNLMEPPLDMHCCLQPHRGCREEKEEERGDREVEVRSLSGNRQVNPIRTNDRYYKEVVQSEQQAAEFHLCHNQARDVLFVLIPFK